MVIGTRHPVPLQRRKRGRGLFKGQTHKPVMNVEELPGQYPGKLSPDTER